MTLTEVLENARNNGGYIAIRDGLEPTLIGQEIENVGKLEGPALVYGIGETFHRHSGVAVECLVITPVFQKGEDQVDVPIKYIIVLNRDAAQKIGLIGDDV